LVNINGAVPGECNFPAEQQVGLRAGRW
jgi:hypothetical protein